MSSAHEITIALSRKSAQSASISAAARIFWVETFIRSTSLQWRSPKRNDQFPRREALPTSNRHLDQSRQSAAVTPAVEPRVQTRIDTPNLKTVNFFDPQDPGCIISVNCL